MKRILVLAALAAACAQPPKKDYSKLISSNPRAILVVPVVNKSVDVDAADYFLSTLSVPLAERGYYVFPVNLVKRMLEDEGMADASLVHGSDPTRLCTLFGADAVLGEELWKDHQTGVYASQSGGQGLAGAIAAAIVAKAAPNYMPMAREANARALAYPGPGFPAGPYRPEYRKDLPPPAAPESPAAAKPAAPRAPGAPQAPAAPQ